MMLLDKGYFDYDFEKTESLAQMATYDQTVKSDEEADKLLARFGLGTTRTAKKRPETLEEIQDYIIKQEGYGS